MKAIKKLILITIISVQLITAAGQLPKKLYSDEVFAISQVLGPLLQSIGNLVNTSNNPKAKQVAQILQDAPAILMGGYGMLIKAEDLLSNIEYFEEKAKFLKQQLACVTSKGLRPEKCFIKDLKTGLPIVCKNKHECIAMLIKTIDEFLKPLIDSILGKITGKQMDPGILLVLAQSKLIPEQKRKELEQKLTDFTVKLYAVMEFLSVLSFIIDPKIIPLAQDIVDAAKEELKAVAIDLPLDEFNFEIPEIPEFEEERLIETPGAEEWEEFII